MVEWGSEQVAYKGPCQPIQSVGVWFCDVHRNARVSFGAGDTRWAGAGAAECQGQKTYRGSQLSLEVAVTELLNLLVLVFSQDKQVHFFCHTASIYPVGTKGCPVSNTCLTPG